MYNVYRSNGELVVSAENPVVLTRRIESVAKLLSVSFLLDLDFEAQTGYVVFVEGVKETRFTIQKTHVTTQQTMQVL